MVVQALNKNEDQLKMNVDVLLDDTSSSDGTDEDDAQLEETDDTRQQMYEPDDDGITDSTLLYDSDSQALQGIQK